MIYRHLRPALLRLIYCVENPSEDRAKRYASAGNGWLRTHTRRIVCFSLEQALAAGVTRPLLPVARLHSTISGCSPGFQLGTFDWRQAPSGRKSQPCASLIVRTAP